LKAQCVVLDNGAIGLKTHAPLVKAECVRLAEECHRYSRESALAWKTEAQGLKSKNLEKCWMNCQKSLDEDLGSLDEDLGSLDEDLETLDEDHGSRDVSSPKTSTV